MVASVDNGNLQPFSLERRGSADDHVTHNSEWNPPTEVQLLIFHHIFMSALATEMRVAVVLDSQFTRPELLCSSMTKE